jgi:lipid II:glycine glycyltransferase (peptidoglycan interpeptide bridge formation enzyme)
MIRKAEKNGITIEHGKGMDLLDKFTAIYNATMDKDHAEEYYYFKRSFYESIHNDLNENYEMFYAKLDDKIIAMSIMIFANGRLNYHLSGSMIEYRNLAPSNLLLYKAALWGFEHGYKTFHLGGGVGSGEDNLYKFKAAFNRNSNYQFSIGKEIFDQVKYDELIADRIAKDKDFNKESKYFPLYRA